MQQFVISGKAALDVLLLLWSSTFTAKEGAPARDAECHKCVEKGHFKCSCGLKKEVGRANDMKRKQKTAKVHELKAQAAAGT